MREHLILGHLCPGGAEHRQVISPQSATKILWTQPMTRPIQNDLWNISLPICWDSGSKYRKAYGYPDSHLGECTCMQKHLLEILMASKSTPPSSLNRYRLFRDSQRPVLALIREFPARYV